MASALSRRSVLRAGTGVLAGAAAAGGVLGAVNLTSAAVSGALPPEADGPLRIGYLPITDAAPLLVAHGSDLYARHDLPTGEPVLFRSWAALAEAFITRRVDAVHLLMPTALQLRYTVYPDARMLAWNHTGGSALTVAPDVTELAQLAGTQVGIPGWWSIHNIVLQRLLRSEGLTPVIRGSASRRRGTVELVVMSPSDMVPALAGGSIAGYTVADPFNAAAEARGIGRIHVFLADLWRDHACCVLLTHQELIEQRPDAVQALTDAVVDGQLQIRGDRAAAAALLTGNGYLPQPPPVVATALDHSPVGRDIAHPGWEPQRIGFTPFPFPSYTSELVSAMRDTVVDGDTSFLDQLDPVTTHTELVDDRFVRAAIARTGGAPAWDLPESFSRTEEVVV